MKKILNETPVRTTNGFRINNIEIDVPKFEFNKFDSYTINTESSSTIKNNFESRMGLQYDKYLNIDIDANKDITMEFNVNNPLVMNININVIKECNIIIKFIGNSINVSRINTNINSNANISIINLLDEGHSFIEFTNEIKDNNILIYNFVDIGGNVKLSNSLTNLDNTMSEYYFNNLYIGKDNDIIDMNYLVNLNNKNIVGKMNVEGILNDNSRKNFKGTIDFKEGSSKSIGSVFENCILLSDNADSKSLPMMLCHEEDVDGSHGVSTGKVDEEKLFYLMSRGYDKESAIKLIVSANINRIISNIPDKETQEYLISYIDNIK